MPKKPSACYACRLHKIGVSHRFLHQHAGTDHILLSVISGDQPVRSVCTPVETARAIISQQSSCTIRIANQGNNHCPSEAPNVTNDNVDRLGFAMLRPASITSEEE